MAPSRCKERHGNKGVNPPWEDHTCERGRCEMYSVYYMEQHKLSPKQPQQTQD